MIAKTTLDGSPRLQKLRALQVEIAGEKASGLAMTGARLQQSVATYRRQEREGASASQQQELAARIAQQLQELMIHREAIGLPAGNLEWILRSYDVPAEILRKLGLRPAQAGSLRYFW
jgi:hypothetical protein